VTNDERWAAELVRRVGHAIKAARAGRSAAWLSERTAELGYRVSPTVIAKLDSGHRGSVLSVVELIVIAAALEVSPATLLYPELPDGDVEVLPRQHLSSIAALIRFTGELDQKPQTDLGILARLSRDLFEKRVRHKLRLEEFDNLAARTAGDSSRQEVWVEELDRVIDKAEEIRDLEARIRDIPGAVVGENA